MPAGPPVAGPPPPPAPATSEPAASAPPPPLTDEERNRQVVATTAAIALVAVAVMIGTFLVTRGDGESAAPQPAADPSGAEPSTSPGAGTADVDQVVADISPFVEQERELTFLEDVTVEVLDEAAYAERAREQFNSEIEDDRSAIEDAAGFYQAIDLWPPGTDPVETLSQLFTAATLGFYDSEADELVVRGGDVTPLLRATLAHELTHALDDQRFDLDRPALDDRNDEAGFAFSALAEGDATRVENAYRETLTPDEQVAADAEESQVGADADISAVPPIAILEQQFLYDSGGTFVQTVYDEGGNAGVDQAFDQPPTTTEQIMEPDQWLGGQDEEVTVDLPEADGEVVDDAVAGQFVFDLITDFTPGGDVPEWDGDHYVLWQEGSMYCVRLAIQGDVQGYATSLADWASQTGAEVAIEGDQLIASNCS